MFDEMGKSIDAVDVATPDHFHAIAESHAMRLGKHVYGQKPLTQTIYEARYLSNLAKETGVVTQMGNQGSAADGLRRAVECIQAGLIGQVKEVHIWTNRPIWPQGMGRPTGSRPGSGDLQRTGTLGSRSGADAALCARKYISRSTGAAGWILAQGRWATWPVTLST